MKRLFLILIATSFGHIMMAQQATTSEEQKKAMDLLRKTMAEQDRQNAASSGRAPGYGRTPTFAEVEEQYLQGKISAKQFQKLIQQHKLEPGQPAPASSSQNKAVAVLRGDSPAPSTPQTQSQVPPSSATKPPQATVKPPATGVTGRPAGEQAVIADVERRMDELIRKRAERQETTNTVSNTGPKTKRQKLDDLLKLYIEGKIPEADYNQQRAKIIAEPE